MQWILRRFDDYKVESILDIGCGIGRFEKLFNKYRYLGLDIVSDYIKRASIGSHMSYVVMDAQEIREHFVPKSYDAVLLYDSLEHFEFEAGKRILNYASSIARKCVAVYTPSGFIKQTENVWGGNAGDAQVHKSGWTRDDLKALGFNEIHQQKIHIRAAGPIEVIRALRVLDHKDEISVSCDTAKDLSRYINNISSDPTYQRIEIGDTIIREGRVGSTISWKNIQDSGISFYNKTVCDIGCFNGFFSFKVEECGAKSVNGFDADASAIEVCSRLKKLKKSNCQFFGRRFGNKWFFDKKYDIIISLNMLHHVRKQVGLTKYKEAINDLFMNCKEAIFEIYPQDNEIIGEIAVEHGLIPAKTIKGHRHGRVVVYYAPWLTSKRVHIRNIKDCRGINLYKLLQNRNTPFTLEFCVAELDKIMQRKGWDHCRAYNPLLYNKLTNNINVISEYVHNGNPSNQPIHDLCLDSYETIMDMCDYVPREDKRIIRGNEAYTSARDYLRFIDCINGINNGIKLPPIGMRKRGRLFQGHFRVKSYIFCGMNDIELDYLDEPDYHEHSVYFVL